MKTIKFLLLFVLLLTALAAAFVYLDSPGQLESAGSIEGAAVPQAWLQDKAQAQEQARLAREVEQDKQILFGDLHVHSTFSMDAFLWSLPIMNGEGVHPPADACDYARYCSSLDFWSLTDHAESLTPRHWSLVKDMVRQCNARTEPDNPDLVTFLGWEWTQVGQSPEDHYGHRNVVLLETEEDKVPTRPIASGGLPLKQMRRRALGPVAEAIAPYVSDYDNRQQMKDQFYKQSLLRETPDCASGVPVRELPADCIESAETPEQLWAKLDDWNTPALAIPHGTSWGFYTPPGVKWDKQLDARQHNVQYQRLLEVFSGHGNSEEYRDFRAVTYAEDGSMQCPEPSEGYLPCCHQAGELIRQRCEQPGSGACQSKVEKAKADYLQAGVAGHLVVPGAQPEDWLNCGQCTDCYLPALNYRSGNSAQYIMALSNFDQDEQQPERFRFGFIASSDNHASQPGTGYKEVDRHKNTETAGAADAQTRRQFVDRAKRKGQGDTSIPFDRQSGQYNLFQYSESERLGSFFYTGGLVAAHSQGRQREAVWDALQRKEVYATSGDRILLWFDLIAPQGDRVVMGSELSLDSTPSFEVRAVGAFEQLPGCPPHSVAALGEARLQNMCGGECYNPGDTRKQIERIEVVRIRPQAYRDEPIGPLIEDPWKVLPCPADTSGCTVRFSDEDFTGAQRDALYYVRAIQSPSPTINGEMLRCQVTDEQGQCLQVDPCYGDARTPLGDDCLAEQSERAWSSPIFVNFTAER